MEVLVAGCIELEIEKVRSGERLRVQNETELELEWWGDKVIENVSRVKEQQLLVEVPDNGTGVRLISKIRNGLEPRLLIPTAHFLLEEISHVWKQQVESSFHKTQSVSLSITSLYRSQELQDELIDQGSNAVIKSSHQAGAAIDIDPGAYYIGKQGRTISAKMNDFNRRYIDTLNEVLDDFVEAGKCNVVYERGFKIQSNEIVGYDSCYHVCVSPDFVRVK